MPNGSRKDRNYDLWGRLLFVISALFFVVSSIRNGDIIGLLGGIWPAWRFTRLIALSRA